MTLRDFYTKIEAHRQRREDWERIVRLQTHRLILPHLGKGDKLEPRELWLLPSETKAQRADILTGDDAAEAFQKLL